MKGFKSLAIFVVVVVGLVLARPSTNEEKRLIKTSETEPANWLTQEEIYSLVEKKINFMDVTNRKFPVINSDAASTKELPSTLRFEAKVREALGKLSTTRINSFLTEFSSYHNRHYQSQTGVQAAAWLLSQANEAIVNSGYSGNATVRAFSHSWAQDSIIARIEGSDPQLKSEIVVLGAHLDSIVSGGFPVNNAAPGADDNASGSAALLETLRALVESNIIPKRTIEIQWYAAEEIGLRGSGDIAEAYYDQGVNVISMLNFDVVGYFTQGRNEISFLTDYTDRTLNDFLKVVVEGYLSVPWMNSVCGYGCSDHASWTEYGIPAASPSEPVLSPYMHTTRDVMATVSVEQVQEFAKLAVGYSIEIAEPN